MVREVGGTHKSGIKALMEHQQKTKYKITTNPLRDKISRGQGNNQWI